MVAINSKFSTFADGGNLEENDIVVGLRGGVNTRFNFAGSGVITLVGTAFEIDVDNTDPSNPVLSLSSAIDAPGTFTINSSTIIDSIIDDDSMASATATNISTSEAVKAYVDSSIGGVVDSVTGTANEVNVDNTDPANPVVGLSSTLDAPGTFNIQSSTAINSIIDDDSMATATNTNISTSEAIVAYIGSSLGSYLPLAGGTMSGDIAMGGNNVTGIGSIRIANGGNYIGFSAPALAGNLDYILPNAYPAVTGYILSSDTAGNMSWIANTAGSMVSVVGTTNEIDVDATDPQNPILSLSNTVDLAGTFNIQSSTAVDSILDEDNMVSDSPTALATQQSIKAYVDSMAGSLALNSLADGRLTLTTGVPVTSSNVTAATTIYYTPYVGNSISLYNGATWDVINFTEISISVPATTSQMYDIWCYNNAGTATLELLAWTNDTTRATALAYQNGVYVKSGDATRRYLGSFRTTAVSGQTEDSTTNRLLWNYYNRVKRYLVRAETTNSWTYSTGAFRQANANTANQLGIVQGVGEDAIELQIITRATTSTATTRPISTGIGIDSTTVSSSTINRFDQANTGGLNNGKPISFYSGIQTGYHYFVWLEFGGGGDVQTWFSNSTVSYNSGIFGNILS